MRRELGAFLTGALLLTGAVAAGPGPEDEPPACENTRDEGNNGQAHERNPNCDRSPSGGNTGGNTGGSTGGSSGGSTGASSDFGRGDYVGPDRRDDNATWRGSDTDRDGVDNRHDNCWAMFNPDQQDTDGSGAGDACDADDDNDGIDDSLDNCSTVRNRSQADGDRDGIGDACDTDWDNDGTANADDNCPTTFNPMQVDRNRNGVGDACEAR